MTGLEAARIDVAPAGGVPTPLTPSVGSRHFCGLPPFPRIKGPAGNCSGCYRKPFRYQMPAMRWPDAFADVARLIGDDAAASVCRAFGGRSVYVPNEPRPEHVLVRLIGMEAARELASMYAGCVLAPPLMRPTLRSRILAQSGSNAEVAKRLGCTTRWVREVKRQCRKRTIRGEK